MIRYSMVCLPTVIIGLPLWWWYSASEGRAIDAGTPVIWSEWMMMIVMMIWWWWWWWWQCCWLRYRDIDARWLMTSYRLFCRCWRYQGCRESSGASYCRPHDEPWYYDPIRSTGIVRWSPPGSFLGDIMMMTWLMTAWRMILMTEGIIPYDVAQCYVVSDIIPVVWLRPYDMTDCGPALAAICSCHWLLFTLTKLPAADTYQFFDLIDTLTEWCREERYCWCWYWFWEKDRVSTWWWPCIGSMIFHLIFIYACRYLFHISDSITKNVDGLLILLLLTFVEIIDTGLMMMTYAVIAIPVLYLITVMTPWLTTMMTSSITDWRCPVLRCAPYYCLIID